MPIQIDCPSCHRQLQIPENLIGKKVQCPSCGLNFTTAEGGKSPSPGGKTPTLSWGEESLEPQFDPAGLAQARNKITVPGIFLLLIGILGLLADLNILFFAEFDKPAVLSRLPQNLEMEDRKNAEKLVDFLETWTVKREGKILHSVGAGISFLISLGAGLMLAKKSRGMALLASVLAMFNVPYLCCLPGFPLGIWSLIVLNKPEVKAVFQRG